MKQQHPEIEQKAIDNFNEDILGCDIFNELKKISMLILAVRASIAYHFKGNGICVLCLRLLS